jgi:hypothetical protein
MGLSNSVEEIILQTVRLNEPETVQQLITLLTKKGIYAQKVYSENCPQTPKRRENNV